MENKTKLRCACGRQIIWFFDKPTILACPKCETTHYYTHQRCPNCGTPLVEFTAEQFEVSKALAEDDEE